jgi:glycosyltransferase involved in cell wall biosynthesis
MKPRILFVAATQLSSGGVERFLLGLIPSLQNDYEFALLSGAREEFANQIQEHGCGVFHWDVNGLLDGNAARALAQTIREYQPDLVHFQDARARLIAAVSQHRRTWCNAYTVHLPPYYYRWGRFTKLRRFLYAAIERIFNTCFSDAVVYPSRRGWEEARRWRLAPASRLICIPNGIDLRPFESPRQSERVAGPPVICTVARLSPEKNIGLLIEAASLLKKRGRDFSLWIVGEGPQRAVLEQLAEQRGVMSLTKFLGRQEQVAPILFQADIFALTSWYEGGRAQAVMEAQAAGLPCVLSDVGDNASMLDGQRGLLFPEGDSSACADQLEALLLNPQGRLQMGAKARHFAFEVYNLQTMADQYRQVYESLLDKRVQ